MASVSLVAGLYALGAVREVASVTAALPPGPPPEERTDMHAGTKDDRTGTKDRTLMRFTLCEHCGHRDRCPDDAATIGRMCNGCGHLGSLRFIGVTDSAVASALAVEFPTPTVDAMGVPCA